MFVKSRTLAAVALLALVGGLSTARAVSADAAAPSASSAPKLMIFSAKFGTAAQPNFIETVSGGVAKAGQPTVLNPVSDSNPGQDIVGHRAGTVSDFYQAGLVSAGVNQHYGSLKAAQIEFAPSGVRSNLCVGLDSAAFQGEALSLQPCTTPGTTVFIIDTADSPATAAQGMFPLVSGSTTDFAHPFAMTYYGDPSNSQSVDNPIRVARLLNNPTSVDKSQLWGVLM